MQPTNRMTLAEYQELLAKQKKSKHNNVKTKVDGIIFDSQAEEIRY